MTKRKIIGLVLVAPLSCLFGWMLFTLIMDGFENDPMGMIILLSIVGSGVLAAIGFLLLAE